MIGMVATLADESAVDNVVAHIATLPDNPTESTVNGSVENGKRIYTVCAYCHGSNGMGIQSTNAPRLAGSSDWYMARQLGNFKTGVRGAHPEDYYGFQMGLMGITLRDEQAINDVIAYINTL
jgi:cytochrome c oxidase subunit 2